MASLPVLLTRYRAEIRFGVRVAVAGLVTYALARLAGLSQGYWAVFTSLVVIQASVGASLKASIDRLIGTVGGAIYGGAIVYFVPHDTPGPTAVAIVVALFPLGVLAAIDDRFRVAPLTAAILLLAPAAPEIGPVAFTGERVLEIALGGFVAIAVSLAVLPARAHGLLAEAVTRLLGLLADEAALLFGHVAEGVSRDTYLVTQPKIRQALARLDAATQEAVRERRIHLTDDPDPEPIARTARRLRNDLIIAARAVSLPMEPTIAARLEAPAATVAVSAASHLRAIAGAFETRSRPPPLDDFNAANAAFQAALAAIRSEGLARGLSADAAGRLFSLAFALEQLGQDLGDMTARAAAFARPDAGVSGNEAAGA